MDIYHDYGNDLVVGQNGDLMTADGIPLSNQRIIRRLLTTPISVSPIPDYLQQPTYGAGLGQFIGQLDSTQTYEKATGLVISNMYQESTVSQTPPPNVQFTNLTNGPSGTITYNFAATNEQAVITF